MNVYGQQPNYQMYPNYGMQYGQHRPRQIRIPIGPHGASYGLYNCETLCCTEICDEYGNCVYVCYCCGFSQI